ncbi:hypothetical protein [Luteolibacter marinus]|uniref:hypothetical protein n=1 Tax=Luteolibacter marinus TaxID=2776705 RepID=UPI001D0107F7|nr:hypothetical protein [Luteolibacter marinus]
MRNPIATFLSTQSLPFLRARTWVVLRVYEVAAYAADMFGARGTADKGNVLIYGQGRSGTTLLEDLLCSTGHFTGHHEVLNTVTREVAWPERFVRGLGRRRRSGNLVVHVKPEHLCQSRKRPVSPGGFLQTMLDDGWTIVHVERIDVPMQVLSKYIAKARGAWHKSDNSDEVVRLHIPAQEFLAKCKRCRSTLEAERKILDHIPHIRVTYEGDLEQASMHQAVVDRIVDEIGLERRPVSTLLKKINRKSSAEILTNIHEIRSAITEIGLDSAL